MNELEPTRREELLADAALGWVDDADRAELDALLADPSAERDRAALERAPLKLPDQRFKIIGREQGPGNPAGEPTDEIS
jgi:hypothetical protein